MNAHNFTKQITAQNFRFFLFIKKLHFCFKKCETNQSKWQTKMQINSTNALTASTRK